VPLGDLLLDRREARDLDRHLAEQRVRTERLLIHLQRERRGAVRSGRVRALGIAPSVFEPPQQMAHRHVDGFVELDVVELVELHAGLRAEGRGVRCGGCGSGGVVGARLRAEGRGAPRALDGRVGFVLVAVALDARVAVEGKESGVRELRGCARA